MSKMPLVVIESPYASSAPWPFDFIGRWINRRYLRRCMHDAFRHGEAPFASHGLYTQPGVLDDGLHDDRMLGIHAGFAWGEHAVKRVFYMDRGFSKGMRYGQEEARRLGQIIEYRCLDRSNVSFEDLK